MPAAALGSGPRFPRFDNGMTPHLWQETLRCPTSSQPLHLATPEQVAELEARRQAGTLALPAATPQVNLAEPIRAAFVREDGLLCYLVEGSLPVLLPDHGVTP